MIDQILASRPKETKTQDDLQQMPELQGQRCHPTMKHGVQADDARTCPSWCCIRPRLPQIEPAPAAMAAQGMPRQRSPAFWTGLHDPRPMNSADGHHVHEPDASMMSAADQAFRTDCPAPVPHQLVVYIEPENIHRGVGLVPQGQAAVMRVVQAQ